MDGARTGGGRVWEACLLGLGECEGGGGLPSAGRRDAGRTAGGTPAVRLRVRVGGSRLRYRRRLGGFREAVAFVEDVQVPLRVAGGDVGHGADGDDAAGDGAGAVPGVGL